MSLARWATGGLQCSGFIGCQRITRSTFGSQVYLNSSSSQALESVGAYISCEYGADRLVHHHLRSLHAGTVCTGHVFDGLYFQCFRINQ